MAAKSGSLDYWRNYFRTANSDVFDIIDKAISVAAADCPKEFMLRRDRIAEHLFSCRLDRCSGCDKVKVAPAAEGGGGGDDGHKACLETGSKESKVNSSRDDHGDLNVSNYSYGEAEALTDEIEEASQIVEEVLRIKEILDDYEYQSEQLLFDSLRKLQLMDLSVDILKSTEIGKAVNGLRKHGSKRVRHLSRVLIDLWKEMVDEWVNATKALAEGTPESANPSVVYDEEEEGLPSPPMDDFFAAQPTAIELSQFFDGMDDDGNPRNSGEFNRKLENGRKPNQSIVRRKPQSLNEVNVHPKDKGPQMKKEANVRPNRPTNPESGPGRPPKANTERRSNIEMQQKSDKASVQRRPLGSQQDCSDDASKLEVAKRKLQERYQQVENAKRQRTIQVMELQDIPKQGLGHRNPHMRAGRQRANANGRLR